MSVTEYIEDTVSGETKNLSLFQRLLLMVLSFLSFLYGITVFLRNQGYLHGLFTTKKLRVPVISIGNILAGGAGKTPTVLYLAELLKNRGYCPAILTRGYRRDGREKVTVVGCDTSPAKAGDEPLLLARNLSGVPVLVGRDRFASGQLGIARFHPDVFVMDDGFQYLSLQREVDVVVIDASRPLVQALLPRGYLREPVAGLERADGFILTRIDQVSPEQLEGLEMYLKREFSGKRVFHSTYLPVGLVPYSVWRKGLAHGESGGFQVQEFIGKKAGLFAGIASPASVAKTLTGMGVYAVKVFRLSDHQPASIERIIDFSQEAREAGAEILVTTEKDAVKLEDKPAGSLPLYVLPIELRLREGEDEFLNWIQRICPLGKVE